MKKISVRSKNGNYDIVIGRGLLAKIGTALDGRFDSGCRLMVVSQANLRNYVKKIALSLRRHGFKVYFHQLPDGENAKSGKELFRLLHQLLSFHFERRDGVIAVGGGVVSDLSGFAASVYLRGIRYVNVATTLLAQVDSSIGGKTGINLSEGKNLMGSFYPPVLVLSDVTVLKSLPDRELSASLAEVVKYGVIRDPELFNYLEKNAVKILNRDLGALERIVTQSAGIKAGVVSRDEFETKGERMILNYGHTFGHGLEGASRYKKIVHGEAVAIGMAMAAHLAAELGLCDRGVETRQKELLLKLRLPVTAKGLQLKAASVLRAMMKDKKIAKGALRFILPVKIGKVIAKTGIQPSSIRNILRLLDVR